VCHHGGADFVANAGYGNALIPIVLSAFRFGRRGALITSLTAVVAFVATELIWRSQTLAGAGLWVAVVNRSIIYLGSSSDHNFVAGT
jgi:glucose-6-phosphate-specific signal transduction histidine kinase